MNAQKADQLSHLTAHEASVHLNCSSHQMSWTRDQRASCSLKQHSPTSPIVPPPREPWDARPATERRRDRYGERSDRTRAGRRVARPTSLTATDLSGDALAVARSNALRSGIASRITFLHGDLAEPLLAGRAQAIRRILTSLSPTSRTCRAQRWMRHETPRASNVLDSEMRGHATESRGGGDRR